MLSQETLDEYRRMTPGQRLELSLRMTEEQLRLLAQGPAPVMDRCFALIRRENDLRNQRILEALARTRRPS